MNRKVLKSFFISVLFLAFLWILPNLVDAAYISITPSTKSASPGQQVSLKISSDCTGKVSLSASNGSVSTGSIWVEGTTSATVTVGSSGTTTISAKATDMSDSAGNAVSPSGSTSITISTGNNGTTSTGDKQGASSTTKSNVATLSNLGITPNDFTGFSAGKTSYDVTVPNEVENITVYANKGQSGQKISGTGSKTLKEGLNTFNITVTAEDGKTTKTYTLNITRKESSSSEPKEETTENTEETEKSFGLSDLKIDGVELKPEFKIDVYEYTVTLTDDKDKLDITANPTLQDSKIEITGNENLKEGENTITIIVTDATGEKTATYQVIVNKTLTKETKSENINIKNLSKKQIFIIALAIVALIIIIIIVVAVKKANKEEYEYYNGEIPYANLSNDDEQNGNEKQIEKNNEETKKKKKHSKGKRFK